MVIVAALGEILRLNTYIIEQAFLDSRAYPRKVR